MISMNCAFSLESIFNITRSSINNLNKLISYTIFPYHNEELLTRPTLAMGSSSTNEAIYISLSASIRANALEMFSKVGEFAFSSSIIMLFVSCNAKLAIFSRISAQAVALPPRCGVPRNIMPYVHRYIMCWFGWKFPSCFAWSSA